MAVPSWGMFNTKPAGGKGYDPDPYDQSEENRAGPNLTVNVSGSREDPYGNGSQEPVNPWTGNGTYTPPEGTTTSPTEDGSGSGGLGSFLQSLLGGVGSAFGGMNLGGLAALLPMYYASQRSADEMQEQAGKYGALGREAADRADPWGNDRRRMFQGKLDDLLENPEDSPIYQSMLRQNMQRLGPQMAAEGRAGTGSVDRDYLQLMGDVTNQFTGEWADRYGRFGGSEVDPGNASRFLMEGGRLEGDAQQAALAARLYPLGQLSRMMSGGNGGDGGGGGSPNGGGSNPLSQLLNMFKNPSGGGSNAANLLAMLGKNPGSLAGLWPNGTPVGPGIAETTGPNVWEGTPWSRTVLDAQDPGYGSWWEGGDEPWDWSQSFGDGGLGINWEDFFAFNPDLDAGSILGMFDIGGPW